MHHLTHLKHAHGLIDEPFGVHAFLAAESAIKERSNHTKNVPYLNNTVL